MSESIREALAEYAHQAWSGWMQYLFKKCQAGPGYSALIPSVFKTRWYRQMGTSYTDLPDDEKQSDLKEADKMLAIIQAHSDTLVLEGPLKYIPYEGALVQIGEEELLGSIWHRWDDTYHSEGPHGKFRVTIERLD